MSRDSGAGAYSNADGTGARSLRFSTSAMPTYRTPGCHRSLARRPPKSGLSLIDREVVRALVAAGLLFPDLHQHVVQKRRRTEPEQVRREPLGAERLVQEDEVLNGLLGVTDAAGRLHPDLAARLLVHVADRLEHDERDRQRGGGLDLPRRRLDEVGAARDGEEARPPDVVVRAELTGLENDLEVRIARGFLHASHLVVDLRVVAGQEGAAVDDHVDLVGAQLRDARDLGHLQVGRYLAGGERRRDRGDLDAAAGDALERMGHEVRVDADGGDRRGG